MVVGPGDMWRGARYPPFAGFNWLTWTVTCWYGTPKNTGIYPHAVCGYFLDKKACLRPVGAAFAHRAGSFT